MTNFEWVTNFAYTLYCISTVRIHALLHVDGSHTRSTACRRFAYTLYCISTVRIHALLHIDGSHTRSTAYRRFAYTLYCISTVRIFHYIMLLYLLVLDGQPVIYSVKALDYKSRGRRFTSVLYIGRLTSRINHVQLAGWSDLSWRMWHKTSH